MNRNFFLIVAVTVSFIFVMPSLLAMFSGSHSTYARPMEGCVKCHSSVADQIDAGQDVVVLAHKGVANNTNYTTYLAVGGVDYNINGTIYTNFDGDGNSLDDVWTWNSGAGMWQRSNGDNKLLLVSLDTDGSGDINTLELCDLCHNATLFGLSGSAHLNVTVRVCDDDRCHGNRNYSYNDVELFEDADIPGVSAGYMLSLNNSHMGFYLDLYNYSTSYNASTPFNSTPGNTGPDGMHISRGYWSCLGCHSEVGVSVNISIAPPYEHTDAGAAKKRYI